MIEPPCTNDCKGRDIWCHAHCEKYTKWIEQMASEKAIRDKEKRLAFDCEEIRKTNIRKR